MDVDSTIDEIDLILNQFARFGIELGLERISRLLAALDHPHHRVPVIHVAGSNGKGSVCAYVSSVLADAGFRVGRYISPHLVTWCERISINGRAIAPADLNALLLQIKDAICLDAPSPTQFEVITAAAWLYFAQQQVDVAVMEVGLGGRLDATNVCDRPLVSVITSISREHWQRLGPTLGDIAGEKAGILKPSCPAVIGVLPDEAQQVIQRRITDLKCPAVWVKPAQELGNGWARYPGEPMPMSPFPVTPIDYPVALLGAHQRLNSAVAIATIQILQHQGWQISPRAIVEGMAKTQWLGRLQWISWNHYRLLVDGAHNPAAAATLRQFVDCTCPHAPIHWVMGMLSTKDHADIFRELLRPGDRLYLVPVPDHSSAEPTQLAAIAQETCPYLHVTLGDDVIEALNEAFRLAQQDVEPVVLCGSLYLIGHFFERTQRKTE
ncbi:MAG: bifunctional folylpolyglutamate synthase/dihydrofolate synthase [Elainellaceae cyanobacterium]